MKINLEIVLKIIQTFWGSSLPKLGSAIALIGATALTSILQYIVVGVASAFGQKISIPDTPAWLGLMLVVIGVATASLGAYWQRPLPPPRPNPHDVALLNRFRALFSEGLIDFLRNHEFSNPFRRDGLAGVSEVAAWEGAKFEFVDTAVEKVFSEVRRAARRFAIAVDAETYPHKVQFHMQTVFTDDFDGWNVPEHTRAAIVKLNAASGQL